MFQIVAAVNDAGVEEGTWTARFVVALTTLTRLRHPLPLPQAREFSFLLHAFRLSAKQKGTMLVRMFRTRDLHSQTHSRTGRFSFSF
jgi:hypothetical protein